MKLEFFVPGHAKTSGSKRAFVPKGWTRPIITEDCKGSKDWRGDVKTFALQAMVKQDWPSGVLFVGPVRVRFSFTFPRPKSHFRSQSAAARVASAPSQLKASAPTCHVIRPDTLKLARAVEDALTGIVWKDDAQICAELLTKEYGDKPGVEIVIETIEETTAKTYERQPKHNSNLRHAANALRRPACTTETAIRQALHSARGQRGPTAPVDTRAAA